MLQGRMSVSHDLTTCITLDHHACRIHMDSAALQRCQVSNLLMSGCMKPMSTYVMSVYVCAVFSDH